MGSAAIGTATERRSTPEEAARLVDFAQALTSARTFAALEQVFHAQAPAFVGMAMRGIYLLDQRSGTTERVSAENVSDSFLTRYERAARAVDPVLRRALEGDAPVYNLELMTLEEWTRSECYRAAARLHRMTHFVQAPILADGERLGTLNFADDDTRPPVTAAQLERIALLARIVGGAARALRERDQLSARNAQLASALDLSPSALVIVDPAAAEPIANRAARELLARLDADEELFYHLTVRPARASADHATAFSRTLDVRVRDGRTVTLHAHTRAVGDDGVLVATLSLEGAGPPRRLQGPSWTVLTAREREVAQLIADGLSDREIAERLVLSPYTVRQHAKRIYQKLGVSSRVQLVRLALGASLV